KGETGTFSRKTFASSHLHRSKRPDRWAHRRIPVDFLFFSFGRRLLTGTAVGGGTETAGRTDNDTCRRHQSAFARPASWPRKAVVGGPGAAGATEMEGG